MKITFHLTDKSEIVLDNSNWLKVELIELMKGYMIQIPEKGIIIKTESIIYVEYEESSNKESNNDKR